ncbi:hypothetical protein [Breznakia pachnodae]|uniref:DNA polymerase III delta prime subunit n=1 Tax=Breznakia pachnodae TaxID=265178 RepID=A0ABU0E9R6_9FIRM|nr:hypothetical protein [Breznakia pachnodae]MDQ0363245.1 DNA polymerase III delta prime subunit [Breznakia pachnodae]
MENPIKGYVEKRNKKRTRKEVATTLQWIDIEEVCEHHIRLKGKKNNIIVGIKLDPHSLFLNSRAEQTKRIHLLRMSLNRLNMDLWHGFVFNPVNLDSYISMLSRQAIGETDPVILEMIDDDIDKAGAFIRDFRELEFFIMLKGTVGNKFEDQFHQLQASLKSALFTFKQLNRIDYDNYISYAFENTLVNDYYFSRGIFGEDMDITKLDDVEDDEDE